MKIRKSLLLASYFLISKPVISTDFSLPGFGFDSSSAIKKDSPFFNLEHSFGNMVGEADFKINIHSDDKTKGIISSGILSVGCPILGAEILAESREFSDEKRGHFSCEISYRISQQIRLDNFSLKSELSDSGLKFFQAEFKEKYGDKLNWSLLRGGEIRAIIIGSYDKKNEVSKVSFTTSINLILAQIKVKSSIINYADSNQKLSYSIYLFQRGGVEADKNRFLENCSLKGSDFKACKRVITSIMQYSFGQGNNDFPMQIRMKPGTWDEEYISYDDDRVSYIW